MSAEHAQQDSNRWVHGASKSGDKAITSYHRPFFNNNKLLSLRAVKTIGGYYDLSNPSVSTSS